MLVKVAVHSLMGNLTCYIHLAGPNTEHRLSGRHWTGKGWVCLMPLSSFAKSVLFRKRVCRASVQGLIWTDFLGNFRVIIT